MDLLLRNAALIDGTGAPSRAADVAVTGDRITAVAAPGSLAPNADTEVVDLDGLVLAPGFIDIHTHYDAQILWDGDLTPSLKLKRRAVEKRYAGILDEFYAE